MHAGTTPWRILSSSLFGSGLSNYIVTQLAVAYMSRDCIWQHQPYCKKIAITSAEPFCKTQKKKFKIKVSVLSLRSFMSVYSLIQPLITNHSTASIWSNIEQNHADVMALVYIDNKEAGDTDILIRSSARYFTGGATPPQ